MNNYFDIIVMKLSLFKYLNSYHLYNIDFIFILTYFKIDASKICTFDSDSDTNTSKHF